MMTSSDGLIKLDVAELEAWKQTGVATKIMAPITSGNLKAALELSKFGEIKHVPSGYPDTTIVDETHVFQFQHLQGKDGKKDYEGTTYSGDSEFALKTQATLNEIWKSSQAPSIITLESIPGATVSADNDHVVYKATKKMLKHTVSEDFEASKGLTEKKVIEKIINGQRNSNRHLKTDVVTLYTSNAQAIIHEPTLKMPDTLFHSYHIEKHSTFGAEDALMVHLWLSTPIGDAFVPAALVTDNPKSVDFWKSSLAGTPAHTNVQLVNKNEIETCIHGNTLFVGWTVHIALLNKKYSIPPACLQIEGYGEVKTSAYKATTPSGYILKTEGNVLEAFVTFIHSESKYSGPGTDGAFGRDVILEIYPPGTAKF